MTISIEDQNELLRQEAKDRGFHLIPVITDLTRLADALGCQDDDCLRFRYDGKPRQPPRPPCAHCLSYAESVLDALLTL